MGKIRRKRTQYHFKIDKDEENNRNCTQLVHDEKVSGFNIDVPDDVFKDVKIDLNEVNKKIIEEDDSRSIKTVRSISKSVKSFKRSLGDIHLKKADKRILRRNLFLKKIQFTHANLSRGKKNGKEKGSALYSLSEIDKLLPKVDMINYNPKVKEKHSSQINTPKPRGISKSKERKKAMINNLDGFKKLLNDENFKTNLMDAVTNCIQNKVFNEEL